MKKSVHLFQFFVYKPWLVQLAWLQSWMWNDKRCSEQIEHQKTDFWTPMNKNPDIWTDVRQVWTQKTV